MNIVLLTFTALLINAVCVAQETTALSQSLPNESGKAETSLISANDSIWFSRLPVLTLGSHKTTKNLPELPSQLDNSIQPWFRPIFTQGQWPSCGQASGVGYNFTYEINRTRNLPANVPENQYPTHFVWNFSNGGYGWSGSSYFHSFEILRTNGTPNIADYGGLDFGGGARWMSGYEKYYNGMHNRIQGVYKIEVGTPDGLLTLKHWLHNHLKGEASGGVASFYANAPWNLTMLPPGTPEAGKKVITRWNGPPTHAMTIIGYNDSIRWDYNNDGQYTNHLDTNGDGVVDMRDWEIGGLIFANSYGDTWGNEGFAFMMYKTLADYVLDGGIWNYEVHVLEVIPDYAPLLTAKIALKHTSREAIKVRLGISDDLTSHVPAHLIDYPIFDFHGGNLYMQGGIEEEHKTIEFGLDITPLLKYAGNGQIAKYFLQVVEYDPNDIHPGEIVSFSIIDYSGEEPVEFTYPANNIPLENNNITSIGLLAGIEHNPVVIQTEEIAAATSTPVVTQLQAEGGLPPYKWSMHYPYYEHFVDYSRGSEQSLKNGTFPGWEKWVYTVLDFPFPFYDSVYHQVTVYPNGFIMFGQQPFPYPYWLSPMVMLNTFKCIAPFMAFDLSLNTSYQDTIWFETSLGQIRINWDLTFVQGTYKIPHSFSAVLRADGSIEFHYPQFSFERHCYWLAGISEGDGVNFQVSDFSGTQMTDQPTAVGFKRPQIPENVQISSDGLLSYALKNRNDVVDISVMATDSRWISGSKTYQITDALILEFAPSSEPMIPGSQVYLDVLVRNISPNSIEGLSICFESPGETLVTWQNACLNAGSLNPGQTKTFSNQILFLLGSQAPDNYLLKLTGKMIWANQIRNKDSYFNVKKSQLVLSGISLNGNSGNHVTAGESYDLTVRVLNQGNVNETNILLQLESDDPFLILQPPLASEIPALSRHHSGTTGFQVQIHPKAPLGYKICYQLTISADHLPAKNYERYFVVGGTQILIVDLDPQNSSAERIRQSVEKTGFASHVIRSLSSIPEGYSVMMLCLGNFPNRYALTQWDSEKLSAFLLNGGRIYMEGGSTWKTDPRKPVHDLFQIEGKPQGWALGADSLLGNPSSIAAGFNFKYKGPNLRLDNMQPMHADAKILFTNHPTAYHFAISFENEVYKTIGSSFKFMGLYQNASDTIPELLMREYLNFFGLSSNRLVANFSSDAQQICNGGIVNYQLKARGNIQSVEWEFAGGVPEFSTQTAPGIQYPTPGIYPVKLIVSDGNSQDTLLIEDYITVELCTGISNPGSSGIALYPNPARSSITIVGSANKPEDVQIFLYKIDGKLMVEARFSAFSSSNPAVMDVSLLPQGLYLARVVGQNSSWVKKLIISNK